MNNGSKCQYASFRHAWKFDNLGAAPKDILRTDQILDELLIVGSNKNWVVQSKYCELVTNIDFAEVRMIMGDESGCYYEVNYFV